MSAPVQKLGRSAGRHVAVHRARSRLSVLRGPSAGLDVVFEGAVCLVGSEMGCDLTIADPEVSLRHLDISLGERGFLLCDLGSQWGSYLGGVRVERAYLRPGVVIEVGASAFRFDLTGDAVMVPLFDGERLGDLVGRSIAMREAMATVVRLAAGEGPALITGEPGVECAVAATAFHGVSGRRDAVLETLVCSGSPRDIDQHLFGLERPGTATTPGALDRAARGTVILADVHEFPLDLQPALLRLMEGGTYRRVGSTRELRSSARIVGTTTSQLPALVRTGQMRADLAARFLQARVVLPPLRHRMEDLRLLVGALLAGKDAPGPVSPALLRVLGRHDWPGNFDELRDVVLGQQPMSAARPRTMRGENEPTRDLLRVPTRAGVEPLAAARRRWIDAAEEAYLAGLLISSDRDLAKVARSAGISRKTLQRLLTKHGLG